MAITAMNTPQPRPKFETTADRVRISLQVSGWNRQRKGLFQSKKTQWPKPVCTCWDASVKSHCRDPLSQPGELTHTGHWVTKGTPNRQVVVVTLHLSVGAMSRFLGCVLSKNTKQSLGVGRQLKQESKTIRGMQGPCGGHQAIPSRVALKSKGLFWLHTEETIRNCKGIWYCCTGGPIEYKHENSMERASWE